MPIKKKKNAVMGRPKKSLDFSQLDKYCFIHCTEEEIANLFEMTVETLHRIVKDEKGITFSEYYRQKADRGKMSLRRRQMQTAMEGNATMQIWLGKQKLGQREPQAQVDLTTDGQPMPISTGAKVVISLPSNGREIKTDDDAE